MNDWISYCTASVGVSQFDLCIMKDKTQQNVFKASISN